MDFSRGTPLPLLKFLRPLHRTHDIGNAHAEVLIDNDDLAFGQKLAIHMDIHWLTSELVQFNDRTI